jgi:squalene-associated FAD-dependent desaturase
MSNNPYRVAIIGAGTSGLAAAVKLANSGTDFSPSEEFTRTKVRPTDISVTIFESRREAGGRTRSFIDSETGDTLDNGQHLLMGCYTSTLEYLRVIGAEHLLTWQNSLEIPFVIPDEQKISILKLPPYLPVPSNLLQALAKTDLLHKFEKLAAARFGIGIMMFRYDRHTAHKSCADLFRFAHQPVTLIKKLWEPLVVGTINLPIEKASAQVFLNTMRTIFLQNRKNSRMLFPKMGLSELLINPALKFLENNNCDIKYGQKIDSIVSGNNLIYIETSEGREVFDAVIYAGHYHDIEFLPKEIRQTIPPVTYSPIANAYLWVDKKIVGKPICGFIDTSLEWCFTKPTHYAAELIACTKSAAEEFINKDNEEIAQIFWSDIKSIFPTSSAKLLRSVVIKEKRATPLLDPDLQLKRPKTKTSVPNLYLAGDLVQNGLPMTIEGAVRNGQSAANEILLRL